MDWKSTAARIAEEAKRKGGSLDEMLRTAAFEGMKYECTAWCRKEV